MFAPRYFAPRYFPPRYFPVGGEAPAGTGVVTAHIFLRDDTIARVFVRDDSPEDVFIQITRG